MDVQVLEIDADNRKLSLGHKQLEENPWNVYATVFTEGSSHNGTVENISDKGASFMTKEGVEVFAPTKHMEKADGSKAKKGEALDFIVLEFNSDARKVIVSHTKTFNADIEDKAATKRKSSGGGSSAVKNLNSNNAEKTTLGDLDALSALKDKLEGK